MIDSIKTQFTAITTKYAWVPRFALKNMRVLLLLLFAGLAFFLVYKVNSLVNSEELPSTATDTAATPTAVSKTPDAEVLSTFNELSVQDVQLDSSFDTSRDNPF